SLRDPCTDQILTQDTRAVTLVAAADGWGAPESTDPGNYANLITCPNFNFMKKIDSVPFIAQLTLKDGPGRRGDAMKMIARTYVRGPSLEDVAACACQCSANFVVGSSCSGQVSDAGSGCLAGAKDASVGD